MNKHFPYLVLLVTILFVLSPLTIDDFSGFTAEQLPIPQVNPPSQPAGYAFSIWGLIYLWLFISALFGATKRNKDLSWSASRLPLAISLGVGVCWLPVAVKSPEWATVIIILMLISAIYAFIRTPTNDRWWLRAPVALYAGWLTAATSVSVGIMLAGYGVVDSVASAYICLAIALGIGLFIQNKEKRTVEYTMAIVWALVAIIVANHQRQLSIQIVSGIGIVVLLFVAITTIRRDINKT